MKLSDAEIRAVYGQGEEAVVTLVKTLLGQIEALSEQVNQLSVRVETLEGQAQKNSRNSSKPPSGDGFAKQWPKSLREKSGKASGGQEDHPGSTLEWREEVDAVERHSVRACIGCGASLSEVGATAVLSRQVFDIPPLALKVTEHQAEIKDCPHCGCQTLASFPAGVSNRVQYGPRLKGMMVYLQAAQLLPSGRTCDVFKDLLGVQVSEGTLYNTLAQCHEQLEPIEATIQTQVATAPVVHFDETGLRVNGHLWWLHVACTSGLTYYFVHEKRGQLAMAAMDILPDYRGKAIHDGWKSYGDYLCEHFLCNAHHLRELQFVLEHHGQTWAYQMSLLLVTILAQVNGAKAVGKRALASEQRQAFEARYTEIIEQGIAVNPLPEPLPDAPKKRGRPKRPPPLNLLERLRSQQAAVLGFMHDFEVPFDNNQAERDLRMMKLKQKISGCFRSEDGARMFCRIRGYLSTLRKQNINLLDALVGLFSGNPVSLKPQPE
ncbi:IS66 family transposase [Alkalinema pantanalense CENA528]|uniref:IS66 family transposase n=1 Tax=Alkalinema pantanalense TaxID=1620705 RepID=UPI003D6FAC3E